nr:AraC family transcriptional regulator N-terminal domain-containing protein [uncultured Oscillibacter sp.]
MAGNLEKLCKLISSYPLAEGENRTALPYLSICLSTQRKVDLPQTENVYIYAVLDGSIRLFTPSGIMDYVPGQFSVSKIDTPASGRVLTFSENGCFLALVMELTLNDVISVLLDLDGNLAEQIANSELDSTVMSTSDDNVIASICRLFSIMDEPAQLAFMGNHIKREIVFSFCAAPAEASFCEASSTFSKPGKSMK